jgi:hypothetical protein
MQVRPSRSCTGIGLWAYDSAPETDDRSVVECLVLRSRATTSRASERRALRPASLLVLQLALGSLAGVCDAQAQIQAELAHCALIPASSERLACYDALAQAATAFAHEWSRSFAPDAARTAPVSAEPAAPGGDGSRDFGFDNGGADGGSRSGSDDGPAQVQSRYDGEFMGWTGKTLFRLENGQVWKQSQDDRVSYRATRPMITIKRGALGSFRLSVQGLKSTIRVERVR